MKAESSKESLTIQHQKSSTGKDTSKDCNSRERKERLRGELLYPRDPGPANEGGFKKDFQPFSFFQKSLAPYLLPFLSYSMFWPSSVQFLQVSVYVPAKGRGSDPLL